MPWQPLALALALGGAVGVALYAALRWPTPAEAPPGDDGGRAGDAPGGRAP